MVLRAAAWFLHGDLYFVGSGIQLASTQYPVARDRGGIGFVHHCPGGTPDSHSHPGKVLEPAFGDSTGAPVGDAWHLSVSATSRLSGDHAGNDIGSTRGKLILYADRDRGSLCALVVIALASGRERDDREIRGTICRVLPASARIFTATRGAKSGAAMNAKRCLVSR